MRFSKLIQRCFLILSLSFVLFGAAKEPRESLVLTKEDLRSCLRRLPEGARIKALKSISQNLKTILPVHSGAFLRALEESFRMAFVNCMLEKKAKYTPAVELDAPAKTLAPEGSIGARVKKVTVREGAKLVGTYYQGWEILDEPALGSLLALGNFAKGDVICTIDRKRLKTEESLTTELKRSKSANRELRVRFRDTKALFTDKQVTI